MSLISSPIGPFIQKDGARYILKLPSSTEIGARFLSLAASTILILIIFITLAVIGVAALSHQDLISTFIRLLIIVAVLGTGFLSTLDLWNQFLLTFNQLSTFRRLPKPLVVSKENFKEILVYSYGLPFSSFKKYLVFVRVSTEAGDIHLQCHENGYSKKEKAERAAKKLKDFLEVEVPIRPWTKHPWKSFLSAVLQKKIKLF